MNLCRGIVHKLFEVNAWSMEQETPTSDQVTSSARGIAFNIWSAAFCVRFFKRRLRNCWNCLRCLKLTRFEEKSYEFIANIYFERFVIVTMRVKRRPPSWLLRGHKLYDLSPQFTTCCLALSVTSLIKPEIINDKSRPWSRKRRLEVVWSECSIKHDFFK